MSYLYDGSKCKCGTWTSHRTGLCTECRITSCDICGVKFVYQNSKQKRCADHRNIKSREAYLLRQNNAVTNYAQIRNNSGTSNPGLFYMALAFFLLGYSFNFLWRAGW